MRYNYLILNNFYFFILILSYYFIFKENNIDFIIELISKPKSICLYALIVELDIIHKNLIKFRGEIYASNY